MKIPDDIRKDVPITSKIIYFDNAATSLTPKPVIDAMMEYYLEYRANVHRGVHKLSMRATEEYEKAREVVAKFIGAKTHEVIFVRNTSEGLNWIPYGIDLRPGDKVVVSQLEHHSNLIIWTRLVKKLGIKVEFIREVNGIIDVEDAKEKIDESTKVVSITYVSNVFGTIQPVKELSKLAHSAGAYFVVDAAQAAGHMPLNACDIGADFLAFSGHKGVMGPTGIGVLYVKEDIQSEFEPPFIGGGTIEDVSYESFKLIKGPERYEAGTPDIGGAIGLRAGIEYVSKIGLERIEKYERKLAEITIKGLRDLGIEVYGTHDPSKRIGVVSFNISGYTPHEVAAYLDEYNIAVRSGHHCCMPLMKKIGVNGTVRASYHCYNTIEEVERMLEVLSEL
ncbi:MAG: cysteine desulfurase [Euryarchaeota archaeon]|nr:cysteine desulfurase [Euryarchaeota archaeon]